MAVGVASGVTGVGVSDGVRLGVAVSVNVLVKVGVNVNTGVSVSVGVSDGVGVSVPVSVAAGVHVSVGVKVDVGVSVPVSIATGVHVSVGVSVDVVDRSCVGVTSGVSVDVAAGVIGVSVRRGCTGVHHSPIPPKFLESIIQAFPKPCQSSSSCDDFSAIIEKFCSSLHPGTLSSIVNYISKRSTASGKLLFRCNCGL